MKGKINNTQLELPIEYAIKKVSPEFYKVIQPNVLIAASNSVFKIAEHRLYNEILSQNHKSEPEKLKYTFSYSVIKPGINNASKNAWRDAGTIIERLQSRVLRLPKEYVEKVYGKRIKRVTFNPFNKVFYEKGKFTVQIDDDFKKILLITKDHFTRGERELLSELKYEWSHKIYWLIREKQPWNGVFEIPLEELKRNLGVNGKYRGRYNNFKAKILLHAQKELKSTWAEFSFAEIRGGKGGKEVLKLKFMFRADIKQYMRLDNDLRFNYEFLLAESQFPIPVIHQIRRKIYNNELICEDRNVTWDYFYVEQTIDIVNNKRSVKDKSAYLYKMLFEGTLLETVENRRKLYNPGKQINAFGEKIAAGNKFMGIPYEEFENNAKEAGLSVEKLCENARYKIIENEEGKFAVKSESY